MKILSIRYMFQYFVENFIFVIKIKYLFNHIVNITIKNLSKLSIKYFYVLRTSTNDTIAHNSFIRILNTNNIIIMKHFLFF